MEAYRMIYLGFSIGVLVSLLILLVGIKLAHLMALKDPTGAIPMRVPFVQRKRERKKPIAKDDFQEWQMEQDERHS